MVTNPANGNLERCTAVGTECDHKTDPTDHRVESCQALCHDHHQQKTQAEARAATAAQQAKLHHPSTRRKPPGLL